MVMLPNSAAAVSVAAGGDATCAILDMQTLGALVCWGSNASGQLALGDDAGASATPTTAMLQGARAVVMGGSHGCAATDQLTTLCWGANDSGQLGNGTTMASTKPVPVQRP
jgi:alpha-tubulin suppressor-like RCC1 family protein